MRGVAVLQGRLDNGDESRVANCTPKTRRYIRPMRTQTLISPLSAGVLLVAVRAGDEVVAGQVLLVIEAMKMEHEICACRRPCPNWGRTT
jgi:biotin carboxyl carrier protein